MEIIKLEKYKIYLYCTIGTLLFPITFIFFYSNFFERELYLNRKRLYLYLKDNPHILNKYRSGASELVIACWEFDEFTLYLWKKGDCSLHGDKGVTIHSFHAGLIDSYYYHKTLNLLKNAIAK